MPRRIILAVLAVTLGVVTADAADLPVQSRLGAIFVEQPEPYVEVYRTREPAPIVPYNLLPDPLWNRGTYNYGSSWSWYNPGPYYGGPYDTDGPSLPYVCGLYGYCF